MPVDGVPGVVGTVYAAIDWDPDGDGPLMPGILVGGDIKVAGDARVSGLAFWNGTKWSAFGGSFAEVVTALCVWNGDLIVATQSQTFPMQASVYRYRTSWTQILGFEGPASDPTSSRIDQMVVVNGRAYIAGRFGAVKVLVDGAGSEAIQVLSGGVIRSVGNGWESLPRESEAASTMTVAVLPNGIAVYRDGWRLRVLDAGDTYYLGGASTGFGEWEKLFVWKGEMYILGPDTDPITRITTPTLYRWLGTRVPYPDCFERIPVPFTGSQYSGIGVAVHPDSFTVFGDTGGYDWKDGVATNFAYEAIGAISACATVGGRALLAASSNRIGNGGHRVTTWDPRTRAWVVLGTGFNGPITVMTTYRGDLCVAGSFTRAGSVEARGIAVRRNGVWESLGSGIEGSVWVMRELDGSLLVSGSLRSAGGQRNTERYARWDGTKWSSVNGLFQQASGFSAFAAFDMEAVGDRILLSRYVGDWQRTFSFRWNTVAEALVATTYSNFSNSAPIPGTTKALLVGSPDDGGGNQGFVFDGLRVTSSPWVLPPSANRYVAVRLVQAGPWIIELGRGCIWDGQTAWKKIEPYPASTGTNWIVRAASYFDKAIVFGGEWAAMAGSTNLLKRREDGSVSTVGVPPSGPIYALYTDGDSLLVGGDFAGTPTVVSPYLARYGPLSDRSVRVTTNPKPVRNCSSRNSFFSVAVTGADPIFYQWRRNGVPLNDGVTLTGSRVSGSTGGGLTIGPATRGRVSVHDEGVIDCVITNACGSVITAPVEFKVLGADFNCNLQVNDADFTIFAAAYDALLCPSSGVAAACLADLNVDGVVDDADFELFVRQYNEY